jgi:hypothetical protein
VHFSIFYYLLLCFCIDSALRACTLSVRSLDSADHSHHCLPGSTPQQALANHNCCPP